ncbi:MAG: hemolysin III family protein [Candidatus Hinthialibacter antarcticus]|nr:hemolysin III family protein [Candidatus Hinthialibacter antarcticus]
MSHNIPHVYTPAEERANILTHLAGVILGVIALIGMVVEASSNGDAWRIVSVSIYGATLVILYSTSTLYHAVQAPDLKRTFRIFDHISIYLLIAGSYTPFTLVTLRGAWGWSLFGVIWGLALVGIGLKIFTTGRWRVISSLVYIGMGWVAVIAFKPLVDAIAYDGFLWLLAGGLFYTFGVIFYIKKNLPYHHAIWHCFVLAGSACHFYAVYFYVL